MSVPPSRTPADPGLPRGVLLAALVGVALRLVFVLQLRDDPFFDEPVLDADLHLRWARAIVAGSPFVEGAYFKAPLYPWFLSLCLRLSDSLLLPRLIQAVLGGLGIVLVGRLGARLSGALAGTFAAWLAVFAWPLAAYDAELLIPALYVPLCLLALELLLRADDRGPRAALLAGAALGAAALARPNVLLFVPPAALWLAWGALGERRLRAGLALLAGTVLVLLPITLRNALTPGGSLVLVSSQAGLNLWIGNHPAADGTSAVAPGLRPDLDGMVEDAHRQAEAEAGRPLNAGEVSRHFTIKTLRSVSADPARALRLFLFKLRLLWSGSELPNTRPLAFFARRYAPVSAAFFLGFSPLAVLGAIGLLLTWRDRRGRLLAVWVGITALGIALFFVNDRFRTPIVPVLCALGGTPAAATFAVLRRSPALQAACGVRPVALLTAALWTVLLVVLGLGLPLSGLPGFLGDGRFAPSDAQGHWLLGRQAASQGDLRAAERELNLALAIHPRLWAAQRELGLLLVAQGRTAEARSHLQPAVRQFASSETWSALAELELAEGRLQAAADALDQARRAAPGESAPLAVIAGRIALARGELSTAADAFRRARRFEPTSFQAAFALARTLELGAGETPPLAGGSDVAAAWETACGLAPASPTERWTQEAREGWVRALVAAGDSPRARALAAEFAARPGTPPEHAARLRASLGEDGAE